MSAAHRAGVTLVELIVVLAILGIVFGLSMPAIRATGATRPDEKQRIRRAQQRALDEGRPVTIVIAVGDTMELATALPDGSVIVPTSVAIDRATGGARARP